VLQNSGGGGHAQHTIKGHLDLQHHRSSAISTTTEASQVVPALGDNRFVRTLVVVALSRDGVVLVPPRPTQSPLLGLLRRERRRCEGRRL